MSSSTTAVFGAGTLLVVGAVFLLGTGIAVVFGNAGPGLLIMTGLGLAVGARACVAVFG